MISDPTQYIPKQIKFFQFAMQLLNPDQSFLILAIPKKRFNYSFYNHTLTYIHHFFQILQH